MPADQDQDWGSTREEDDAVGRVRSPGWLDDPVAETHWRDRLIPERFRGMRLDPGSRGVRVLALVGLAAMVIAGVVVFLERPITQPVPPVPAIMPAVATDLPDAAWPEHAVAGPGTASVSTAPSGAAIAGQQAADLVVSVVGLVHRAGLIRLHPGARVADALAAAGGTREGADTSGLNLAQRLADGDQIMVGPAGADTGLPQTGSTTISSGGLPLSAAEPGRLPTPAGKVDLNAASEAELDALPGVGPVTSGAIIAWRTAHGRFTSVEQLGEVDGIGPVRLARLRDLVTV
ncbi:ComEA family DNA-binding protein [Nocardia sp. 004]|uniref:ComEA family DNA-binding protein n=1 Tax=Nocardia sp. 004 TaxID=3385978 RepID=UPI0039A0F7F1